VEGHADGCRYARNSGFSAPATSAHQLAAKLGLGFAFAHHIQPSPAIAALRMYRDYFRPSKYSPEPKGASWRLSVVCAETEERAPEIARPLELSLLRLRQGRLSQLPKHRRSHRLSVFSGRAPAYRAQSRSRVYRFSRHGTRPPDRASRACRCGRDCGDVGLIHDHADRRHSYELLARSFALASQAVGNCQRGNHAAPLRWG